MGLTVQIWKREGMGMTQESRGATHYSEVLKLLKRVLEARIRRRVEGEFGKNNNGSGRGEEQQTVCTS